MIINEDAKYKTNTNLSLNLSKDELNDNIIKNSQVLNISDANLNDISDDNLEEIQNLSNLDDLKKVKYDGEPKLFTSNMSYNFNDEDERVDVYIKNYMSKFEMSKSLKAFEQEFYEMLSKGLIKIEQLNKVPKVYLESEKLQEEIGNIQKELDDSKIYAEKASSLSLKLKSQKENEKIKHRRVQQEKKKLIKEMEILKEQFLKDDKMYKELKNKYLDVTSKGLMQENELTKLKAKNVNLKAERDRQKKLLDESKKNKEIDKLEKLKKKDDQKIENQITKWTPFPFCKAYNMYNDVNIIDNNNNSNISNFNINSNPNSPYLNNKIDPCSVRMQSIKVFPGHLRAVTAIDIHPKKEILVTTSNDKTWRLWKFPNGEPLMLGEGHKEWLTDANFHPDGVLLATSSGDSTVKIWNILKQSCIHTIVDQAQPIWKCKFHMGGDFLLTACMDHNIRLYDMNNNKCRMSYRAHLDSVNSINFLNNKDIDWNMFLSASADKTSSLWDMRSNMCVQTYYGHKNAVNFCKGSYGSTGINQIVSCDTDGVVKVWDKRNAKELYSLNKYNTSANCLDIDKSGSYAVIGFDDSKIRTLNLKTGLYLDHEYADHKDAILDIKYHLNNKYMISTSADYSFRIWQ